jgi:hypothetical protein
MRELVRGALLPVRHRKLVALHLVGNAALITSAALWLLIPDERTAQLMATAIAGLVIVFLFCWLHAGTLAFSAQREGAFSRGLRHLPAFILFAIILYVVMRVVAGISDLSWQISGFVYSKLPGWLRPVSGSERVNTWLEAAIGIVVWYVMPATLLPLVAGAAEHGFSMRVFGAAIGAWVRLRYWILFGVICALGVVVPKLIMGWTPGTGLRGETISLVIRLSLAYVLAVAAWLMACGLLGHLSRTSAATRVEDIGGKAAPQPA